MKPGDRVKFAARWLRSVGLFTGLMPFAVGTIESINGRVARVHWGADDLPAAVLIVNLTAADRPELD
jgi:hypothetical protein